MSMNPICDDLQAGRYSFATLVEQPPVDGANPQLRQPVLVQHRLVPVLGLHNVDVRHDVLGFGGRGPRPGLGIEVLDDLDVVFDFFVVAAERLGQFRNSGVLQEMQMVPNQRLDRRPLEAERLELQQQALARIACGHAGWIEGLDVSQGAFDRSNVPRAQGRDFVYGRDQIPILVDIADDRRPDFPCLIVSRLQVQLPHQVVGERALARQGVLNGRQFLHFLWLPRTIPVVQILAEEVLVVLIVPGIALLLRLLLRLGLLGCRCLFLFLLLLLGRLFGRDLFEHRVLNHLLVEQFSQLDRRHRQKLDRLLQRRRQDELLDEPRVKFLLND